MMIDFAFMHPIGKEILANNNKWDQFMVNFSASIKKSVNSTGVSQGVSHPIQIFDLSSSGP